MEKDAPSSNEEAQSSSAREEGEGATSNSLPSKTTTTTLTKRGGEVQIEMMEVTDEIEAEGTNGGGEGGAEEEESAVDLSSAKGNKSAEEEKKSLVEERSIPSALEKVPAAAQVDAASFSESESDPEQAAGLNIAWETIDSRPGSVNNGNSNQEEAEKNEKEEDPAPKQDAPAEIRQVASEIVARVVKDAGRILEARKEREGKKKTLPTTGGPGEEIKATRRSSRSRESKEMRKDEVLPKDEAAKTTKSVLQEGQIGNREAVTKVSEKSESVNREDSGKMMVESEGQVRSGEQKGKGTATPMGPTRRSKRTAAAAAARKEASESETVSEEGIEEDINDIADFIRESEDKKDASAEKDQSTEAEEEENRPLVEATLGEEASAKRKKRKSASERKSTSSKKSRKSSASAAAAVGADVTAQEDKADSGPPPASRKAFKPVQNWRKTIRLPLAGVGDRLDAEQVFPPSVLPAYIPCVPPGTSQRLIDYLTDTDVDLLCCPGCKDRFIMPTTFFQHVYRKSAEISFSCQACSEVLTFHNRCHLKIHVLSHMEQEGVVSVAADFLQVKPMSLQQVDTGYRDVEQSRELDALHAELSRSDPDVAQCTECHQSMRRDRLRSHFQDGKVGGGAATLHCDHFNCGMALPTRCAALAHERAHSRSAPHVCPECGVAWETWRSFAAHAQDACHHDARVLALSCRVCLAGNAVGASAVIDDDDILSHMYATHVRLYYKCTGCPKAFDNKAAIYAHREESHKNECDAGQPDFNLLYKAPFLRGPNNLFSSRQAIEEKIHRMAKKWERFFAFKCSSCESHFADVSQLSRHNRRWCRMQNWCSSSVSAAVSSAAGKAFSSLFPSAESEETLREKKRKVADSLEQLRNVLGSDCRGSLVAEFQKRVVGELESNLTPSKAVSPTKKNEEGFSDSAFPDDADEEEEVPVGKALRNAGGMRRGSLRNIRSSSKDSGKEPQVQQQQQQQQQLPESEVQPVPPSSKSEVSPVETVKSEPSATSVLQRSDSKSDSAKKKGRPPLRGRGAAMAAKERAAQPFVESLGVDVPSMRSMLAFNNLGRRAHLLGSSVVHGDVGKRKRRHQHGGRTESPLGVVEEDSIRMDRYQCGLCDFSSDLRDSFQCHIRVHRPRDPARPGIDYFQCRECGMSFASEPAWKKHLFLLHAVRRPEAADYCEDALAARQEGSRIEGSEGGGDDEDEDEEDRPLTIDEGAEEAGAAGAAEEEEEEEEATPKKRRRKGGGGGGADKKKRKRSSAPAPGRAPAPPPGAKNVCAVCNRSFPTPPELRRHFRGHGMAYLSYMHSSPTNLNDLRLK